MRIRLAIMNEDGQTSPPVQSGRFELLPQKFDEMAVSSDVVTLNLKEVLPDLFANSQQVPRSLERVWRRAVDDVLSENRGIYTYKGGTQVLIYLFEMPYAVSKAKIDIIKSKLPVLLSDVRSGKVDLDQPSESEKKSRALKLDHVPTALEKMIKDGLGDNPPLELAVMWAERTTQALAVSTQKMPLLKEMADLAMKSDIAYHPVWSASTQMLIGSAPRIKIAVPVQQYDTGEFLRQDIALLFGAVFQSYSMLQKGLQPLVFIPLRSGSLGNKAFSELYMAFLRRLAPEIKKNIIFDISGVPKDSLPGNLCSMIENISTCCRAYIFETGLLSYADYRRGFPKLHACSCNIADVSSKQADMGRLIKKYAGHYSKIGVKSFIKSVDDAAALAMAVEAQFTYISGSAIMPAQKNGFAMQKLSFSEITRQA